MAWALFMQNGAARSSAASRLCCKPSHCSLNFTETLGANSAMARDQLLGKCNKRMYLGSVAQPPWVAGVSVQPPERFQSTVVPHTCACVSGHMHPMCPHAAAASAAPCLVPTIFSCNSDFTKASQNWKYLQQRAQHVTTLALRSQGSTAHPDTVNIVVRPGALGLTGGTGPGVQEGGSWSPRPVLWPLCTCRCQHRQQGGWGQAGGGRG